MHLPDILLLGLIGLVGFLCQWLAWRIKLPAILPLLICGILLGPAFKVLDVDAIFGDLLFPFISLCVAVILFEGSLTLRRQEFHEVGTTVRNLVTFGALANGAITAAAAHWLVGLSGSLSALFGAIMVVTGPTVIVPMLRTVRPNARIARILRWEGIIIDPLGALLAVLVYEWIIAQHTNSDLSHVALIFGETVVLGALLGALSGFCLGWLLRHQMIPDYLQNYATVAMVTATFALSHSIMEESGLLAVTIMGIVLANMRKVNIRQILDFKEDLTLIFVSALFIILAARIKFELFLSIGLGGLGMLLIMQFVARPTKVFLSTMKSQLSWRERALLAWMGPRGIVAAAVSAVFGLKLESLDIPDANLLVPLAFSVIVGTVLVQSLSARPIARALRVTEADRHGFLIIGANPLAIMIAKALKRVEVETLLVDTYWENISAARMEGLKTYYGNVISDHATTYLDLSGLGGMLGLAPYYSENSSAALRFRDDFGLQHIFCLPSNSKGVASNKHDASEEYTGRILFTRDISYGKLAQRIRKGEEIKSTTLSENYSWADWQRDNAENAVLLFALDNRKRLSWFTHDHKLQPEAGWRIFALSPAD